MPSVLLLEGRVGVEVVEQGLIKSLHDNAGGEEDGPHTGLLVELQGLPDAQVLLIFDSLGRLMDGGLVNRRDDGRNTSHLIMLCFDSHDGSW